MGAVLEALRLGLTTFSPGCSVCVCPQVSSIKPNTSEQDGASSRVTNTARTARHPLPHLLDPVCEATLSRGGLALTYIAWSSGEGPTAAVMAWRSPAAAPSDAPRALPEPYPSSLRRQQPQVFRCPGAGMTRAARASPRFQSLSAGPAGWIGAGGGHPRAQRCGKHGRLCAFKLQLCLPAAPIFSLSSWSHPALPPVSSRSPLSPPSVVCSARRQGH